MATINDLQISMVVNGKAIMLGYSTTRNTIPILSVLMVNGFVA